MKLTIIIPVYNSERFLEQCLRSVFDQDLDASEYEVIVINDGSKDRSKNIILDFQSKHPNLVFIDQENQGVSAARNVGLDIAKGEYITFVDSDDQVFPNTLRTLVDYCFENALDLLYPHITYINEESDITGEFKMNEIGEVSDGFTHQRRGFIITFYHYRIVEKMRFHHDIYFAEDALFNLQVHIIAQRCSYCSLPFYQYRKTQGSAVNSDFNKSEKAFRGYIKNLEVIYQLLQEHKNRLSKKQIKYMDRPFYLVSKMAIDVGIIPNKSKSRYITLKKELAKYPFTEVGKRLSVEYPFFFKSWSLFIFSVYLKKYKSMIQWKIQKFLS